MATGGTGVTSPQISRSGTDVGATSTMCPTGGRGLTGLTCTAHRSGPSSQGVY